MRNRWKRQRFDRDPPRIPEPTKPTFKKEKPIAWAQPLDPRIRRDALLKRTLAVLNLDPPRQTDRLPRRVPLKTVQPLRPPKTAVKKAARLPGVQDPARKAEVMRGPLNCKPRPKRNKRKGSGGSRAFVPWC